jgi:hypothetical protein
MTTTAQATYDGEDMKEIEGRVMNSGVSQNRQAEILQQNTPFGESIDGVIAKISSGTGEIQDLTLQGKSGFQQAVLRACYAIGIKSPEGELAKAKEGYESRSRLLENMKEGYQNNKKTIDDEILDERGWVFDCDKVLQQKESEKEELEKELAYEAEEVKKCKAAYKAAPTKEQKEELIEMVRGYDTSRGAKEKKIEDLTDEVEIASDSFNDHYEDLQELQSDRNEQIQLIQATAHLQRGYRRVARTYSKILEKSNKGKITDCKLLGVLAADLNAAKDAKTQLEQIHRERKAGIAGIPAAIKQAHQEDVSRNEEETAQVKRVSEAGVNLARQRRAKLYTPM